MRVEMNLRFDFSKVLESLQLIEVCLMKYAQSITVTNCCDTTDSLTVYLVTTYNYYTKFKHETNRNDLERISDESLRE